MTKRIRVENADTTHFKVEVEVWNKSTVPGTPDTLSRTVKLHNPCEITTDVYIHSGCYLIVKEVPM